MYDLSNIPSQSERRVSPYIIYGSNQVLKVNKIELVRSPNTGSKKAVLHMETKPLEQEGFTPVEGAKGKVGKIGCGVYMKNEQQKQEFFHKMLMIATALGLQDEFTLIKGDVFEDVVSQIEQLLCCNKYARYTIFGEQYAKHDAKIGLRLMLPRWGFVESLDVPENESKLIQFDENNPKHFTRIEKVENLDGKKDETSDLPF